MTFAYVALEPNGKKKTGYIDAADEAAAISRITAEGKFVVEIREETSGAKIPSVPGSKKVSRGDVALFTRRLSDLAAAGLPLDRVLSVVAEQAESAQMAAIAEDALQEVRGGLSVSQALAKYPKVFPEVYTQTLRAGEASGQFPEVSGRLADFLEKEVARKSQIASAMVYPIMLALTAVFVVNMLLFFVVPKMSGVFSSLGDDLPWNTKFLLGFSTTVVNNLTPILIALVAIIVGYRVWVATERGAYLRDKVLLRMPLVGKITTKAVISRYSRVLGTLVFGGVPILESLTIAGLSAGNRVFKETSEQVVLEVKEGKPIAQAMRDTAEFPPVLTHMVAIGEETGDLPKMLGRVSDSLDFEVDTGMRRLTSMVEPIIVLAMGAFVGFVVISILLPIFQAQDLVK